MKWTEKIRFAYRQIKALPWHTLAHAAIRAAISVAFFVCIVLLVPRANNQLLFGVQAYFFISRLIMSFSGILSLESNKTFLTRKAKYFMAYEYYLITDVFKATLSKID